MAVQQLDPTNAAHVAQFSVIRLRALQTDPAAFDSTYERELAFGDDEWRARLTSFARHQGAVFAVFADVANAPVGIVGVVLNKPTDATICGMWVAPESRRRGIATQLLDSAEAWTVESGAATATLWVHHSNNGAQALYRSRGYELVEPDNLPSNVVDACCGEVCMRARLAST